MTAWDRTDKRTAFVGAKVGLDTIAVPLRDAAERKGVTVSDWLREALLEKLDREGVSERIAHAREGGTAGGAGE